MDTTIPSPRMSVSMLWKLPFKECWFCKNKSWYFLFESNGYVHIVQEHFWINHCDSVVDHWSKGWPCTPYIHMRQNSGQKMHGQFYALPLSAPWKKARTSYISSYTSPRRVTISVSAFYICNLSKTLFCNPKYLQVLPKESRGKFVVYAYKSRLNKNYYNWA